jgi:hypothetical protein
MPRHRITLPVGVSKLLQRIVRDSPDSVSVSQLIAQLVLEGTDLLVQDGGLGNRIPPPVQLHPNDPIEANRPTMGATYLNRILLGRVVDLAWNYKVPADIPFWRSLVIGALRVRMGGQAKFDEAVRAAMSSISNDNIRIVMGDPAPPLYGMPRKPMRLRSNSLAGETTIVRLPMSPRATAIVRAASIKLAFGSVSNACRKLLTDALPHLALVSAETPLLDEKRGDVTDGISVSMPVDLLKRYDAIAALIGPRARSRLMRHALLTQLKRELRGGNDLQLATQSQPTNA